MNLGKLRVMVRVRVRVLHGPKLRPGEDPNPTPNLGKHEAGEQHAYILAPFGGERLLRVRVRLL